MSKIKSRPQRVRLFRNDQLEQMALVTPMGFALTWVMFLGVALFASWGVTTLPASLGLVLMGLLIWTLFEYCLHRFVFHLKLKSKFGQWLIFLIHDNHHAVPNDPERNLMPPIVSVTISGSIWLFFYLLLGPAGSVLYLGFGIGYVLYDCTHFACHQLTMRGPVLRALHRHHIRHHYAGQDANYAITAIFWDRVFGTCAVAKKRCVKA